jgi:hypothetical protein
MERLVSLGASVNKKNRENYTALHFGKLFLYIFWRARVCLPLFAYVAHFCILRDVWIRTQKAAAP